MLKKTITYKDFNDDEVSEDHFFHLSKAELVEIEMSHDGGLSAALENIIASNDGKSIIAEFKKIILGSYGKKSPDGKRFVKNQELRDEFESSEAYSTLFMELVTDTGAAIDFVNGIIPSGMIDAAAALTNKDEDKKPKTDESTGEPKLAAVPEVEPRVVTRAELVAMSGEELKEFNRAMAQGEARLEIGDEPPRN